jgi:hypothetical protein
MEIPEFWFEADGVRTSTILALFEGPDDVQALVRGITREDTIGPMPARIEEAIKALRPLSRKYIAHVFKAGHLEMKDNPRTRELGFFGDWKPVPRS